MPFLLHSLTESPDILLDKPIVLVGRHQDCDVQIPSRKISRKHCCIAQVNDYVVVRDLFSTNGVSINGKRVEEGSLKSGDELSIAHFRYQLTTASEETEAELDERPIAYDPVDPDSGPATEKAADEDS